MGKKTIIESRLCSLIRNGASRPRENTISDDKAKLSIDTKEHGLYRVVGFLVFVSDQP